MKKLLTMAVVAVALTFASSKVLAYTFPWVPLNISATVKYSTEATTNTGTTIKGAPLTTVSINNKSIISMLNQFGPTNIPAGSVILYNPDYEGLLITNKNGFSYYPEDCYIEFDSSGLIGTFTQNDATAAGTENDLTGLYMELYFNGENYIKVYGLTTWNWTYGTQLVGEQPTKLSVSMSFQGSYDVYIDDYEGEVTSGKASGSGSALDPSDQSPFIYWY